MTTFVLPDLPEPAHNLLVDRFTGDQMRAYGKACAEAARREAIEWCISECKDTADSYKMQANEGDTSGAADHKESAALEIMYNIKGGM